MSLACPWFLALSQSLILICIEPILLLPESIFWPWTGALEGAFYPRGSGWGAAINLKKLKTKAVIDCSSARVPEKGAQDTSGSFFFEEVDRLRTRDQPEAQSPRALIKFYAQPAFSLLVECQMEKSWRQWPLYRCIRLHFSQSRHR